MEYPLGWGAPQFQCCVELSLENAGVEIQRPQVVLLADDLQRSPSWCESPPFLPHNTGQSWDLASVTVFAADCGLRCTDFLMYEWNDLNTEVIVSHCPKLSLFLLLFSVGLFLFPGIRYFISNSCKLPRPGNVTVGAGSPSQSVFIWDKGAIWKIRWRPISGNQKRRFGANHGKRHLVSLLRGLLRNISDP